jgi:hypothetical protein
MASHAPEARVLRGGVPLLATSSAPRPGRTTRSGPLRYASLVYRARPAALMGFAPFAGLLPQSGGWRVSALAGPTCRWLHATSRTVSRDRFRRGRSRRLGATTVGERRPVERSAIRDASASGLRLPSTVRRRRHETGGRDPALGFSPLSGLPGAYPRAHARDSSHHRAVTSLRNPFGLPSAHGFRRRSFPRCRDDLHRRLTPTRLLARFARHGIPRTTTRDPQHIAGPFSVLRG